MFYISFILAIKITKNGLNRGFLKRWEKILSIIHQTCQKSVLLLPPTVRSAVIVTIHSKTFFLLQCVAKWKFGYAILEIPFFTKLSWLVKKILYYFSNLKYVLNEFLSLFLMLSWQWISWITTNSFESIRFCNMRLSCSFEFWHVSRTVVLK